MPSEMNRLHVKGIVVGEPEMTATGDMRVEVSIDPSDFEPHELALDTSASPLYEAMVRITDADSNVVWEGKTRDLHELLRNRWAAFTDDELGKILGGMEDGGAPGSDVGARLIDELYAELERRHS